MEYDTDVDYGDDHPSPCSKCQRSILFMRRWHQRGLVSPGRPAILNATTEPDDRLTWLEVAPGSFVPANHHYCPGKPDDELRKEREKHRKDLGLDLPRRRTIQGTFRKKPSQIKLL